jgi:hypothetical protein
VTDLRAVTDNLGTGGNKFSLGTMVGNVTNVSLTVTDTTITAGNVLALDNATSGAVTLADWVTVTGTQTELTTLFGSAGIIRPDNLNVNVSGILFVDSGLTSFLGFVDANNGEGSIAVTGSSDANVLDFSSLGFGLIVDGGGGNDIITGTAFSDTLTGGNGNDTFVLNTTSGTDTVTDFGNGADVFRFDISGLGLNGADYTPGASTAISAAEATQLAIGGAANHVLVDTATAIANFTDSNNAFSGGVLAIETDEGRVLFDADGNFTTSGDQYVLATFTPGVTIGSTNLNFIA